MYAPQAELHPMNAEIIATAKRRWQKNFYKTSSHRKFFICLRKLRARTYIRNFDADELIRTTLVALFGGELHGYKRPRALRYEIL